MKNALQSNGNKAEHMKERISKLKGRNLEMIQEESETIFKNWGILWELYDSFRQDSIRVVRIPEEEKKRKGAESLLKEIIDETIPNLEKELDIQVHGIKRTLSYLMQNDLFQDT